MRPCCNACGGLSLLAPCSAPLFKHPLPNPSPCRKEQVPFSTCSIIMTWSVVVRSKREQRLTNALLNAEESSAKGQGKGKSKGKGRTGPAGAEPSRKPEWTCRSCQTPNFMNRDECRRCGEARPAKGKGRDPLPLPSLRKSAKPRSRP